MVLRRQQRRAVDALVTNKNLVKTYIVYKQKREEIKARQRVELERELEPFLKEVGSAIIEAQSNGKRIEDIEYEIGAKNRTLVYRAKRLAKGIKSPDYQEPADDIIEPPERSWRVEKGVQPGTYNVYVNDAYAGDVTVDDTFIDTPDEWAADTENRDTYREVIAHIRTLG